MDLRKTWQQLERKPAVRTGLMITGFVLIALAPLLGVLPGPGGVVVFAAGATLALRYSEWAKRRYVRFKRRHPRKGAWADWGLRRESAKRRELLRKTAAANEAADDCGQSAAPSAASYVSLRKPPLDRSAD